MAFDIHVLVNKSEYDGWIDSNKEENIEIVNRIVRRNGDIFFRIKTTEDNYLFLTLKYGRKNVWRR